MDPKAKMTAATSASLRRPKASVSRPQISAPVMAPIKGELTTSPCRKGLGAKSFLMYESAPEMIPV
jgi:hypothetical protein